MLNRFDRPTSDSGISLGWLVSMNSVDLVVSKRGANRVSAVFTWSRPLAYNSSVWAFIRGFGTLVYPCVLEFELCLFVSKNAFLLSFWLFLNLFPSQAFKVQAAQPKTGASWGLGEISGFAPAGPCESFILTLRRF